MTQLEMDRESAVAALASLCRRICLLEARGCSTEASAIQAGEFSKAIERIRIQFGPGFLPEAGVSGLFTRERERVADAVVLAGLLTDLSSPAGFLADRPHGASDAGSTPRASNNPLHKPGPRGANSDAEAPANCQRPRSRSAPAIADLLDEMLTQESPYSRTARVN